jgi:hypothetical protein
MTTSPSEARGFLRAVEAERHRLARQLAAIDELLAAYREPQPLPAAQTEPVSSAAVTPAPVESVTAGAESKAAPASNLPEGAISGEARESVAAAGESPATPAPVDTGNSTGGSHETVGAVRLDHPTAALSGAGGELQLERRADASERAFGSAVETGARDSEKAAEAPLAAEAPSPSVSAAPKTFAGQLRAWVNEHPGCTAKQAAEALGTTVTRVWSTAATCPGIELRKLRPEEKHNGGPGDSAGISKRIADLRRQHPEWGISEIGRAVDRSPGQVATALKRAGLPTAAVGGRSTEPAPTPAPAPEPPSPAKYEPSTGTGTGRTSPGAIVTKPIVRPKGARFWLRDDDGRYLHFSCMSMTKDRAYAWSGTEQQLVACRRKFSLAAELREVPVAPKEGRVAA